MENALSSVTDALILDLEDTVAFDAKPSARSQVAACLGHLSVSLVHLPSRNGHWGAGLGWLSVQGQLPAANPASETDVVR